MFTNTLPSAAHFAFRLALFYRYFCRCRSMSLTKTLRPFSPKKKTRKHILITALKVLLLPTDKDNCFLQYDHVSASIAVLQSLERLSICFMEFHEMELSNIASLKHLQCLEIENSNFYGPWQYTIVGLRHLKTLKLSSCGSEMIDDEAVVDSNTRALFETWCAQLQHLELHSTVFVERKELQLFPNLKTLILGEDQLDPGDGSWLHIVADHCHNLHHLQCDLRDASNETIAQLSRISHLRHVNLSCTNCLHDDNLEHFAALGNLEYLDLTNGCNISDMGVVAHLAHLRNLRVLALSYCDISSISLRHFSSMVLLQELHLTGCRKVGDNGLAAISSLSRMKTLSLGHCKHITDTGLLHISSLRCLENLDIEKCVRITDAGMAHICIHLAGLTTLNLDGCVNLTDITLLNVASLFALENLNMSDCVAITDQGLRLMSQNLLFLTTLDLSGCVQVSDVGVTNYVCHMPMLETLSLSSSNITDIGVADVCRHLKKIKWLSLAQCQHITDRNLPMLIALPALKMVALYGCVSVTAIGVKELTQTIGSNVDVASPFA